MYKRPVFLAFAFLSCHFIAGAQAPASWCPTILQDSLYSDTLKERRPIQVIMPEKYKADDPQKYDVLYVLDGDWNTKLAFDVTRFVTQANFIPPMIIVSIPNVIVPNGPNLRGRDYTPTRTTGNYDESGGADHFLGFLKKELIPYINRTYPSTGHNTLWGTSLGGLLTVYALLKDPEPFDSYVANDPSLWWDNQYTVKLAAQEKEMLKGLHKTLWINGRAGKGLEEMGIAPMDTILPAHGSGTALQWSLIGYPFETHLSEIFKGCYEGIKFSYSGYTNDAVEFYPMRGIVLQDKPLKIEPQKQDWWMEHYTTDGSEPNVSSPVIDSSFFISGPADVVVKALCFHDEYSKTARGSFVTGDVLKNVPLPSRAKKGGLHFEYYTGDWKTFPELKKLKPALSGSSHSGLQIDTPAVPQASVCVLSGWIEVAKDGYYMFATNAMTPFRWQLGAQVLIGQDTADKSGQFKSFVLPLAKGYYPIRMEALLGKGQRFPFCIYMKPGEHDSDPLAADVLYHL